MISKLTKEQENKIKIYQKKWYDKFHSLDFDEDKSSEFIDWLYSLIGQEKPIKIFLDSPLACQLAINLLKLEKGSPLDSQLDLQLNSQLSSPLWLQLWSQLNSQLSSPLWSQLRSQLDLQLRLQLDLQLRLQLGSQLDLQKLEYFDIDFGGDVSWYGYLCFYDFCYKELFPEVKIPIFEKYISLCDNISSLVTFDGICFISRPPKFIQFDESNRLHCSFDYALYFNDGWGLNYIHGVYFDKELFDKFKTGTLTSKEIISLKNAEQKAVLIQEIGYEKIFNDLEDKQVLDTQTRPFNKDPNKLVTYELFKFSLGETNAHILKVEWYEKERKRQTLLGVPNNITDAIEAVAWTLYITKEQYESQLVMEA